MSGPLFTLAPGAARIILTPADSNAPQTVKLTATLTHTLKIGSRPTSVRESNEPLVP